MTSPAWLLFDLGGVLIENSTFKSLVALLPTPPRTWTQPDGAVCRPTEPRGLAALEETVARIGLLAWTD